ncbi:tetraacyldisaccharide 4'-kinase [Flavobacterium algicola]|uniref:tetraacyldisaccharide 4'-kinase n=1 Tax=Flavobacterium algicola TaxID=556529 RepID=UPI001EFCD3BD|nr:tetraacyldisaccharide 4'-kinase [Flavobacterium algicola]MCG9793018.1 tetraacyldisaccharide 4'-kinase [Flavobacterium algicola]
MKTVRKLLFPFSLLYGVILAIRNFLFDKEILKSNSFSLPIIAVGNLSVGGTGKTPQIEYLVRILCDNYKVATLSRGYKRQSEGFILADETSNAVTMGDEPFQYYKKFPKIQVAVDVDRSNGIRQLLIQNSIPEIILLDDAYQHRKVKAGLYILLTSFGNLYVDDFILPMGNLRESCSGDRRAKIIIVTKCPPLLSRKEQENIADKLNLNQKQELYFSSIKYGTEVFNASRQLTVASLESVEKVLLAGIANPKPFFDYLKREDDICLTYSDHHNFSDQDLLSIQSKAGGRLIITTEKDYVRLKDSILKDQLYYLPIQTVLLADAEKFENTIKTYVKRYLKK